MKKKNTNGSEDLAGNVSDDAVAAELCDRAKQLASSSHIFSGRIVRRPEDLPDTVTENLQLAILPPETSFSHSKGGETRAEEILLGAGAKPRRYRNRVIFALPSGDLLTRARWLARKYLASRGQEGERDASAALNRAVREAYPFLLVPEMPKGKTCSLPLFFISGPFRGRDRPINFNRLMGRHLFDGSHVRRNRSGLVLRHGRLRRVKTVDFSDFLTLRHSRSRPVLHNNWADSAARVLFDEGALIYDWSPFGLLRHLEKYYFKEASEVPLARVWVDLCRYCYMKRLLDQNVLLESANQGINLGLFGYAERRRGEIGPNREMRFSSYTVLVRKGPFWGL